MSEVQNEGQGTAKQGTSVVRRERAGRSRRVWLLLVIALTASFCAKAQSGAGSIQGTVTDPTGAVVPGATIHVVNTATSVAVDTRTNGTGFYQVPDLFTGKYTLTATAPGMKTWKTSLELLVAQHAVINPALTPGEVNQQVTVSADAIQLINKDNGAIESTLENDRINELPMNSRLLLTLLGNTTPGLENFGQSINGLGPEALEYVADGVTTTNTLNGGEYNNKTQGVDPDAVQEVQVETTGAGAQFATPATGILTTKSGTNRLHGTLFETARNNAIGVAKARQDNPNAAAPPLVRNEFGFSAGGPVMIPHVYDGRDKTFWFFAYERYSQAQTSSVQANVPTMAMRNGDFSGLTNSNGQAITIYDPASTTNSTHCAYGRSAVNAFCRTPFPNNQIPVTQMSPVAKIYYDLLPQPTTADNPLVHSNITVRVPQYQVVPQQTFRLDHVFTANDRVYLRYTHNYSNVNITGGLRSLAADGIPAGAAEGYVNNPTNTFIAASGYTHVFSPTFFSETIVSQEWFSQVGIPGFANHTNYEAMLGLPNNFGEVGFPNLGNGTLVNNLATSQTGHSISQIISDIDENLTKTKGKHQMQFGGRFRRTQAGDQPQGLADNITMGANPTAIYDTNSGGNYSAYTNTGLADASFFLGSAGTYTVTQEPPYSHYHVMELDAYFQDNIHVSKNLTLNLGLRYEAHPALATADGLANTFDLKNDAMVLAAPPSKLIAEGYTTQAIITNDQNIGIKFETPADAGMPANTLMKNYNLNFLPRIGAAYVLPFNRKYGTVIRGAYGMYEYPTPLENFVNHPEQNNPFVASYSQSYSSANQAVDGLPNELLRYNAPAVFGVMGKNTANIVNSNVTNAILPGVSLFSTSPDWKPARVTETNLTIEQQFKGNSALRVSWVWTHATNLDIADSYNNHPSNFQYEVGTGNLPPNGGANVIGTSQQNTYAATALGPYDQMTWGTNTFHTKAGWSNDNSLQVNYQRLFHHGSAYQFAWVYSKSLRFGGDQQAFSDSTVYPYADYPGALGSAGKVSLDQGGTLFAGAAPPPPPSGAPLWADYHAMDKFQGYMQDSSVPKLHVLFNGIIDLPVGRGKHFFGGMNRFWNEVFGGFQIAGSGNVVSEIFNANGGNWGATAPIKVYKHDVPIQDCRSGVCQKAYMWFNGYQGPTVTTACTSKCITGLPADYVPDQVPINNIPGTADYGTNNVTVTLANGKQTTIAFDGGPQGSNYLSKTWLNGPVNWTVDASLFKVFPITDSVNFRINMDAFNAFNVQGYNNPGSGGVQSLTSSHNTPRQIQLTARLTF